MQRGHLQTRSDAVQKTATDATLLQGLKPSPALELKFYDVDHYSEAETYAGASSMPLSPGTPPIKRARLALPMLSVSLVKTFPRIVRGYQLTNAVVMVVAMDEIGSARLNGQATEGSILLLKGASDCFLYEPEGRNLAVLCHCSLQGRSWEQWDDGYHLLRPKSDPHVALRNLILSTLQAAAHDPHFLDNHPVAVEQSLLDGMEAVVDGSERAERAPSATEGYHRIVSHMEQLIRKDMTIWQKTPELAAHVGVSVRTLQSATQAICGMSPHRYSRVLRLWSVRKQLRDGSGRRSVKACAMAHGFWHLGEFAASYKAAFGELPSQTLQQALGSKP